MQAATQVYPDPRQATSIPSLPRQIEFVRHDAALHRRHYVNEDDVKVVLSRLPAELLSRLKKVHFCDHSRGGRRLGYTTTRGRREITICALPWRVSLHGLPASGPAETYGALRGSQWPVLAVRRLLLYGTVLHEIGHLQVILPKAKNPKRKYASEGKAREFATQWRKRLWARHYEHPDPVHNPPDVAELRALREGWAPAHLEFKRGFHLQNAKQNRRAVAHYRKAVELYPNHVEALERLGSLSYAGYDGDPRKENWERVAGLLRRALALDPLRDNAAVYLGMTLFRMDKRDEASEMFRYAISIDPFRDLAKTVYAEHLGYWEEHDASERLFKRIVKRNPRNDLALRYYAQMLMYKAERIDEEDTVRAIELLKRALEINPRWIYSHYDLGIAYYWLSRYEEALHHFREVAKLQRGDDEMRDRFPELKGYCETANMLRTHGPT